MQGSDYVITRQLEALYIKMDGGCHDSSEQLLTQTNATVNMTQNVTNYNDTETVYTKFWYILFARDVLLLPPTMFGNILILFAIGRFPGLCRATSGVLIGNLAVADLLMGVMVLPADMGIRLSADFAKLMTDCALYQTLIFVGLSASVLSLFLLSIERFHAIMNPLRHAVVFTKRRVYLVMAVIWVFVAVYGCLSIVTWHGGIQDLDLSCPMKALLESTFYRILCFMITITIALNTIFFIAISRVVLQRASVMVKQGSVDPRSINSTLRRDIRHTVMVLMVSGLFILFWGPFCVISVIPNPSSLLEDVHVLLAHIAVFNSCSNWIIYGWRSRHFRAAFRLLLKCRSKQTLRSDTSHTRHYQERAELY